MAQIISSQNPLKDAIAKLGKDNINRITALRIAKSFTNSADAFVGFEGRDKYDKYFCFRVDYDPIKKGHVNLTINDSEKYEYTGVSQQWYIDVINNINGDAYCGVRKDSKGQWMTKDQEKNQQYIDGMKKYMNRVA